MLPTMDPKAEVVAAHDEQPASEKAQHVAHDGTVSHLYKSMYQTGVHFDKTVLTL